MKTYNKKPTLEYIFYKKKGIDLSKLKIDDEAIHFVTPYSTAILIHEKIKEHLMYYDKKTQDSIIVDCNGCVGGDSIVFASYFKKVLIFELDEDRVEEIRNNMDVYGFKNYKLYNGDSTKLIKKVKACDVIYFDPPWGGSDYKSEKKITLSMGNMSMEDITLMCFDEKKVNPYVKIVVIKIPQNYDIDYFKKYVTKEFDHKIYYYEIKKIGLLIIHRGNKKIEFSKCTKCQD